MKKEIKLLKRSKIKEYKVEDIPSIVISYDLGEYDKLSAIVSSQGYYPVITDCEWPRDLFLEFDDKYITTKWNGTKGEGGFFVQGDNYIVFSNEINGYLRAPVNKEKLGEFFGCNVYSVDSYWKEYIDEVGPIGHIDLTILPLPRYNLIFIDKEHYDQCGDQFDKIVKGQNLEMILVDHDDFWPLNCLVLDYSGDFVIIANSLTKNFLKQLRKLKIPYKDICEPSSKELHGSIRCRTNQAANPELFKKFGISIPKMLNP